MSPEDVAWEMMKSEVFQNTKCELGGPEDTPVFSISIPTLRLDYVNDELGIENGEMEFTRSDGWPSPIDTHAP